MLRIRAASRIIQEITFEEQASSDVVNGPYLEEIGGLIGATI